MEFDDTVLSDPARFVTKSPNTDRQPRSSFEAIHRINSPRARNKCLQPRIQARTCHAQLRMRSVEAKPTAKVHRVHDEPIDVDMASSKPLSAPLNLSVDNFGETWSRQTHPIARADKRPPCVGFISLALVSILCPATPAGPAVKLSSFSRTALSFEVKTSWLRGFLVLFFALREAAPPTTTPVSLSCRFRRRRLRAGPGRAGPYRASLTRRMAGLGCLTISTAPFSPLSVSGGRADMLWRRDGDHRVRVVLRSGRAVPYRSVRGRALRQRHGHVKSEQRNGDMDIDSWIVEQLRQQQHHHHHSAKVNVALSIALHCVVLCHIHT
ncbi:uncharacterized protein J3D65DRAFT_354558 [Phyllosticta citribraziliensis]|uniref:Uncharacterized protein n=1 Tax=Phyllosticta citribraziliensis TaxID=989973 RepID=A0ABR1LNP8_9PEZI